LFISIYILAKKLNILWQEKKSKQRLVGFELASPEGIQIVVSWQYPQLLSNRRLQVINGVSSYRKYT